MFSNLNAELARNDINLKELAVGIGMKYDTLRNKMNGRTEFTRIEMYNIKNKVFPGLTIDYLFDSYTDFEEMDGDGTNV